jgi:hypothetical protein
MQINSEKIDDATLQAIGREVVQLLKSDDIGTLAARYGYAVALGRDVVVAIREDLADCLRSGGVGELGPDDDFGCDVKFFKPNQSNLLALVECLGPVRNGTSVLVEVIISFDECRTYATLEQISAVSINQS